MQSIGYQPAFHTYRGGRYRLAKLTSAQKSTKPKNGTKEHSECAEIATNAIIKYQVNNPIHCHYYPSIHSNHVSISSIRPIHCRCPSIPSFHCHVCPSNHPIHFELLFVATICHSFLYLRGRSYCNHAVFTRFRDHSVAVGSDVQTIALHPSSWFEGREQHPSWRCCRS
jgi:hypothetical protein